MNMNYVHLDISSSYGMLSFLVFFFQVFSFTMVLSNVFYHLDSYVNLKILKLILMQQPTDITSDEESFESDGDGGWPFQTFVEQLLVDMFDPGK